MWVPTRFVQLSYRTVQYHGFRISKSRTRLICTHSIPGLVRLTRTRHARPLYMLIRIREHEEEHASSTAYFNVRCAYVLYLIFNVVKRNPHL
jgi:hypothetical protein